MATAPDSLVFDDDWSDLRRYREMPDIDVAKMCRYRLERNRGQLQASETA